MPYRPSEIEPAWQAFWETNNTFVATEDRAKPKFYALDMFPYPSGTGLHVGHPAGYTASDVISRFKRARGFNVLHPMGYDSFGLPAEQRAIKEGIAPQVTTAEAITNFRRQLKRLGFSYDWSREVSTADPSYYKWTQWIFTKLYEKGLAYEGEVFVNWCPALGTVLANDEVIDGKSERGGHPVERKSMRQWMLKQTAFAERFLSGLETIDWPEATKTKQREWVGKSDGAFVDFAVNGAGEKVTVFTTRPDTLWGATYMVLAPEHALVEKITTPAQRDAVAEYQKAAASRSEVDRKTAKKKTGVDTGARAVNPVTGQEIPVWIADYVLAGYGTGAIMAVPAHDERDWEFAKVMGLPIVEVVSGGDDVQKAAHSGEGALVNSGELTGTPTAKGEAVKKAIAYVEQRGVGKGAVTYKMRDWAFARQRYWGEPIPVLRAKDGTVRRTLDVSELPLELPAVDDFKPTGTGESPLSRAKEWVAVNDAKTGEALTRETNTMPGSAGSSWYFLRYCDPHNEQEFCSRDKSDYWMPVDLYVGGSEHSVGHLMYARMWQKALKDFGFLRDDEPFAKLRHQGMVLGETFYDPTGRVVMAHDVSEKEGKYFAPDGSEVRRAVEKMSKRLGNVVNPDDVVSKYGSDALRVYICFMGPLESDKPWQTTGLEAQFNWLKRAWRLFFETEGEGETAKDNVRVTDAEPTEQELRVLHKAIKKVTGDIETLNLNTAVSALHVATRDLAQLGSKSRAVLAPFAQLIAPFAPHFAEEVWKTALGKEPGISYVPWPAFDEKYATDEAVTVPVQVSGKTKGTVQVPRGSNEDAVKSEALKVEAVQKALEGKSVVRVIFVPDRMLNLVVK